MLSKLRHNVLWMVLGLLLTVQLIYGLTIAANFNPSVWVSSDFAAYATAMMQQDIPGSLPHDSLFGDGRFTATLWASSWIYMKSLQVFYHLGGERIEIGAMLFGLVLLAGYICGMYLLALTLLRDRHLAVGVAACCSLAYEIFLIGPYILAQALFATLTPLLLFLLLRVWLLPGLARERIVYWQVFLCGILVGLTPFLINSTNALGFICFTLGIAGLQWIFRRLPLWTILVFLAALLPLLIFRIFGGIGVVTSLSASGVQYMAALYQNYENNVLPYGMYAFVTLISGISVWRFPRLKIAKIIFITTQLIIALTFFYTGWMPIFVWLYGMYRILFGQDDGLDTRLLLAVVIAIWVGPLLQLALYYVWRVTNMSLLVGIIFETARFARYGYIPLYLLAARAVGMMVSGLHFPHATSTLPVQRGGSSAKQADFIPQTSLDRWLRAEPLILLVVLFALLMMNALYNIQPTLIHIALVLTGGAFLGLQFWQQRQQKDLMTLRRVLLIVASLITIFCMVMYLNTNFQLAIGRMTPKVASHYALTTWTRENTPQDSLFHVPSLDESFRFLAQRSMVIAAGDVTRSLYSTRDPYEMQSIIDATLTEKDAARLTRFAAQYGAEYVVLDDVLPDMLPALYDNIWYAPELVYENAHYRVYQVQRAEWLFERPYPLSTNDTEALENFTTNFDLDNTAIVFNPVSGDIFNYEGIENWLPAYALRDGTDPDDVFTLTKLVQHMQSPAELDAETLARWQRNYLPGDLKAANVGYVFITQNWLDNAGAYIQALFADENHYQFIRTIPALINADTYLLYAVIGDSTESIMPEPLAESMLLPIAIAPDVPLIFSTPTLWRGVQLFRSFINNRSCTLNHAAPDCPLMVVWGAGEEAIANEYDAVFSGIPAELPLQTFMGENDTLFLIDSSDIAHETRRLLAVLVANGYVANGGMPVILEQYPGLTFTVYHLRRVPEDLQTFYQFGDTPILLKNITLLTPEIVKPCESIGLQTWWMHEAIPAQNYFITLRLVAENGDVLAQSDGRLGEHRLNEVPARTLYYDERWLTVPCDAAAGAYRLQAGLYSYENGVYGALLPARDAMGQDAPVPTILLAIEVEE